MIPNQIHILTEGLRIYRESMHRKRNGWQRFSGGWREICHQIVQSCWNGRYFQSSTGHFRQFYARDFGMSLDALIRLGYGRECALTLSITLSRYTSFGRITTAITPSGRPFDFPNVFSPDSVAYIFKSLALINDKDLIHLHHQFLQGEIHRFFSECVNPDTGLAKRKRHFGGMKDYAIRDASCYDSTMIALMAHSVAKLARHGIENPLSGYNFKKMLFENYWKNDHFIDDLSGADILTADANLYPFLHGVITSQKKLKRALASIQEAGLQTPFPLKYEPAGVCTRQLWSERFVLNWERTAHWSNLGVGYLSLLKSVDKNSFDEAFTRYCELIERHGTLFECYTPDGKPYQSRWYHADEGMIWVVNLIKEQHNSKE